MKPNKNIPISNHHLWNHENTLPVSLFIVDPNNSAGIKEMIGLDSDWKWVEGKGDRPFYYTYHKRYSNEVGYRVLGGKVVPPLEGITIRWEGNPFKIQM